ncbi:hypothetical protein ACP70R_002591 [Stipagrostis hirtigluma subsp. patula]
MKANLRSGPPSRSNFQGPNLSLCCSKSASTHASMSTTHIHSWPCTRAFCWCCCSNNEQELMQPHYLALACRLARPVYSKPSYSGLACPVKAVLELLSGSLAKWKSVESFDVDIKEQKVTVKGNVTPDAVLQTVSKTGKKTSFWEAEPVTNQSAASADATAAAS